MTNKVNLNRLKIKYALAQKRYYEGKPTMTDAEFDKLEDRIRKLDPEWVGFKSPGSNNIRKKQKVELPTFMPSLGKAYPEAVDKWLAKSSSELLVMDKLDGSSVLAVYTDGRLKQLITRGNGTIGQDITFLASHTNLPTSIPHKGQLLVRCEAIMKQSVFNKHYAETAENPRNLVAGILNRKLSRESVKCLKYVDFVVLGLIDHPVLKMLATAKKLGFQVVSHRVCPVNGKKLSALLKQRREESDYEMDGLVLARDTLFRYKSADRPTFTIAFKENPSVEEAPITKVKRVIWQSSPVGRLTPKIEVEPLRMDGVTVKHATAHNAKWMLDRGIGVGAVVRLVRSGGVIPKIVGVETKSKPALPEVQYEQRGVHFWLVERTDEVAIKNMVKFLATCGVEQMKMATMTQLHEAGITNIRRLIKLASSKKIDRLTFLHKAGFAKVSASNLSKQLERLHSVSQVQLMVGSGIWEVGLGKRRLEQISKHIPLAELVTGNDDDLRARISSIPGFKQKTADMVVDGLPEYRKLHAYASKYLTIEEPKVEKVVLKSKKWCGLVGCWTGYRDKQQEAEFIANGGTVAGFSSKTTHLFYRETGKQSSKVQKAGDRAITWERFVKERK